MYGPCPDYKSNAIQYDSFTIAKQARNVYSLNANINVTRAINSSLTVNAQSFLHLKQFLNEVNFFFFQFLVS